MTLIICPIKECQRLRNVLSNSVPSMTNTKETLRPIRECFLNSPIKECSSLPKETCTEEISQRDLQVPLENVFIVTQRDLHIRNFPKRLKVPSENVFVITKEHSLMGLLFGKLSLFR